MEQPSDADVERELRAAVGWFIAVLRSERRTKALPLYCDRDRIGAFAVDPDELAAGKDAALFRLFVTLTMFQGVRDVVVMRQQRSLPDASVDVVADLNIVQESVAAQSCVTLSAAEDFEERCDVSKSGKFVDCDTNPGASCHVKEATVVFGRMGDMGKLPTSAALRFWRDGGVREMLDEVCREEISPTKRAALLVERFGRVHRVGRKLATLFVSALSVPALAPGLTPWFPRIQGNELVVVDTNVARAVDILREPGAAKTYEARASWVRKEAARVDLREFHAGFPSYSPRLLQQALYSFCSKSNRRAAGDPCGISDIPCADCAPLICPFHASSPRMAAQRL